MTRFSLSSTAVRAWLVVVAFACAACAGPQVVSRPGWVDNPPNFDSRFLYFVAGSGWRASESDAKSAAKVAASGEVPRYIASQIQSLLADVQVNENGVDTNRVEIAVTVVGTAVTIRGVTALEYWCTRSSSGYDCSALVSYPTSEYLKAVAEIDAAERAYDERQGQSAASALTAYDLAKQLETAGQPCPALQKYKDSAAALRDLGRVRSLADARFPNTDLLSREVSGRLAAVGKVCSGTEKWLAVRVVVTVDGAESEKDAQSLFAALTTIAARYRFETNRETISASDASRCLSGDRDAATRAAGPSRYLLVIRAKSEFSSERFGLEFYSRASADWALVDPSSGAVIASGSPSGVSGAGISRAAACQDAVNNIWTAQLASALNGALAELKR